MAEEKAMQKTREQFLCWNPNLALESLTFKLEAGGIQGSYPINVLCALILTATQ